jgi:phage terminase small subunit
MPKSKKALDSGQAPGGKAGKLTEQQELFCQEFLKHLNATHAYKAVYKCADSTADANGPKLLGNARVSARIAELKAARNKRLQITQDQVLELLWNRCNAKLSDLMEWDNNKITLKSSKELKKRGLDNVTEVTIRETKFGTDKSVRLKDDGIALGVLVKHVGLFDRNKDDDSADRESFFGELLGTIGKLQKR